MADFYKTAKTISLSADVEIHMQAKGMYNRMSSKSTIVAQKPNRIAIRGDGGMAGTDLISDGQTLVTFIPMMKQYSESDAPESLDELAGGPMTMMGGGGMVALHLLANDPYSTIMEGVTSTKYLGKVQLDGKSVHHLHFVQDQFNWEAWIDAGEQPLLHRVSMDMSKMMAQGGGVKLKGMKMTVLQNYKDWKFDTALADDVFVFVPPAGVTKSDNLFGGFGGGVEELELSPLLGKPAPPVELKWLDGGDFTLADHAGSEIVMLDFWATWCGPCVKEMPLLADVADEFKSKGVVFFAVNQGDDRETIRDFLKQKELEIPVALDASGQTGTSYEVKGIPTLVLIDKKGIVQAVHVGYNPNIKQNLRRELNDLLAGKDLVKETIAKHEESLKARPWGPEQATGEPDTPLAGDNTTAWASLSTGGQPEWLTLRYAKAVIPKTVLIHETYNPGAVNKVSVFTADGTEVEAWKGQDPTPVGRQKSISKIDLKVDFKTDRVKIYIDSPRVPGWNEIDAVGLVDKTDQTQWAVAAKASSSYAEQAPAQQVVGNHGWGPEQATGEPNTLMAGDLQTVWASATPDSQPEWLLLEYGDAVQPKAVVIHETFNPGAVNKVSVFDADGDEHVAWTGRDPTPRTSPKGISVIPVKVKFKTKRVKVYIDYPSVAGWNEIDAVGLRDADGKTHWAAKAEASTTFAQPQRMPANRTIVISAQQLQKFTRLEEEVEQLRKDVENLKRLDVELKELRKLIKDQNDQK